MGARGRGRFFTSIGEKYKAEWIHEIPRNEAISVYRQGEFVDLCAGPHLPSTGRLGHAFKLTKVAGAYWRGDARNAQLQRIYGTAWASEKELKQYLFQIEEAEKRDHRRLGRELGLFHLQEEAVGSVFWHPKGLDALSHDRKLYPRAASSAPAMSRCTRRSSSTARCGRRRAIGRSSASTCSPWRTRTAAACSR